MPTDSTNDRLLELREELARLEIELADMKASMPKHSIRVHQQLALEDAEDEVQRLTAEIAALEGEKDPGG